MTTNPEIQSVGSFELRVLASIRKLGIEASATSIRHSVGELMGREVAVGQLYLALSKLEKKGLISFTKTEPKPIRGQRSKKIFHLDKGGIDALAQMAAIIQSSGVLSSSDSPV